MIAIPDLKSVNAEYFCRQR